MSTRKSFCHRVTQLAMSFNLSIERSLFMMARCASLLCSTRSFFCGGNNKRVATANFQVSELLYQPGDTIKDRYKIVGVLGQGGTAITYEAEDTKHDRSVAIKVLSLYQSQEWKAIELFEREAKVLASLSHPQIPQYYDYFYLDLESDRHFCIVQELIPGKSLKTLVEQGWRFQEADVKKIAEQVLEILSYLHSLKPAVIHRDIKPHNLIQTEAGEIYLVDFGAVQDVYRNTITRGATFVGTIDYMSPEQIRGQTSFASDLYSLGCTLLFLLTRRSPSELPITRMKLDFRSKLQLSDSFAAWLDTILEPVPEDRFESTTEAISKFKQETFKYSKDPEYSEHMMPIRGSRIELKRNRQTLRVKIPPIRDRDSRNYRLNRAVSIILLCLIPFSIILIFGILASINLEENSEIAKFLMIFAVILGIFLINEIPKSFCTVYLKIEKGLISIKHQIWKFTSENKISTKYIERLRIKKEEIRNKNNVTINYYIAIYDGRIEYTFGKYLSEVERNWLLETIALHIEYFYPGTRSPVSDHNNIWFKR